MSEEYDDVGPQKSGVGVSERQLKRKSTRKSSGGTKSYRSEQEKGSLRSAKPSTSTKPTTPSTKTTAAKPSTSTKSPTVIKAEANIVKAQESLKQAESLKDAYGSKIQWGDETYDLGTTAGWKKYRAALRKRKREINKAENQLKRHKTAALSFKTATEANAVIEAANDVIRRSNKIIEQSNKDRKAIYDSQVKLYETVTFKNNTTQKFLDDLGEQFNSAALQVFDKVNAKVKDSKRATQVVEALTPIYTDTIVKAKTSVYNLFEKIENLKRDAEGRAEWGNLKGDEKLTTPQAVARLEHLALASGDAFIKTIPAAVVATSGYVGAGLVAAASTAYFVSPRNRYYTAAFIGKHPQEFYASIAGSLAAGYSVAKVRAVYTKYRAEIKSTALKNKMDKLIDDYAYLEQHKGAEFPSRAVEIPEPQGGVIIIDEPIIEEAQIANNFLKGVADGRNGPQDIEAWLMKNKKIQFMYGPSYAKLSPTDLEEIIIKHPQLKDPFIHPAFQDPSLFGKADLVARVPGTKVQAVPLMSVVLNRIAQQGYITDADIKEIVEANKLNPADLEKLGITPWDVSDFKDLSIPDAVIVVGEKPIDIDEVKDISKATADQIPSIEPIEEPKPAEEPMPIPPIPTPKNIEEPGPPKPTLSGKGQEEMKRIRLRLFNGPREKYEARFNYKRGQDQTLTVEARSFPEAMTKAQRGRRLTRQLPESVELVKRS